MLTAWCGALTCAIFDILFRSRGVLKPGISTTFENYHPSRELIEYALMVMFPLRLHPVKAGGLTLL